MNLRRTLVCALSIALLSGSGLATAAAAQDRISVSGTLVLDEEDGEIFAAYIQTEDREYLVSGVGSAELRKNAGEEVTATGDVTVNGFGEWLIEVRQLGVAEP